MSKNIKWLTVIVIIILVIAGVWYYGVKPSIPVETGSIKIGGAFGLTGICAGTGQGELKVVSKVIEDVNKNGGINGRQINLIVEDTACDNKGTITAVQKLINVDDVIAIIGPTWGDSFQAGALIINENRIPAISPSAAMESFEFQNVPFNYIFSTWLPVRAQVESMQEYAIKKNLKNFVITHDLDPWGITVVKTFMAQAKMSGVNILREESNQIGTEDFRTSIIKIRDLKPDAILVSFLGPEDKLRFIKQSRELGLKAVFFSTDDIQNENLVKNFSQYLEGIIYSYGVNDGAYEDFVKKYQNWYGQEPKGQADANAYDAINILIAAMIKSNLSSQSITDSLLRTEIDGTVIKKISFNDRHQITSGKFEVRTFKDGKSIVLEK